MTSENGSVVAQFEVEIVALSARQTPPKASSPGQFTAFGKKNKIDAENRAQLDRETGLSKPGPVVKKGDMPAMIVW